MSAAAADALGRKKLRVEWPAPPAAAAPAQARMLEGLWAALRQQHAAPGNSQDERLEVRAVTPGDAGTFRVSFRYVFDNDYASQYDETEAFDAEVVLDRDGALVAIGHWTQLPT